MYCKKHKLKPYFFKLCSWVIGISFGISHDDIFFGINFIRWSFGLSIYKRYGEYTRNDKVFNIGISFGKNFLNA